MIKKYVAIALASGCLAGAAFCQDYNPRVLDMNAEDITRHLWSGRSLSRDFIQDKLTFVLQPEALKERPSRLEDIYSQTLSQIPDSKFLSFATICHDLYREGNEQTKLAVSLLFQKVSDKSLVQFKRFEKLRKVKEEEQKAQGSLEMKYLGKADKSQPLVSFNPPNQVTAH